MIFVTVAWRWPQVIETCFVRAGDRDSTSVPRGGFDVGESACTTFAQRKEDIAHDRYDWYVDDQQSQSSLL